MTMPQLTKTMSPEDVLKHYKISIAHRFNDEMRFLCPFHDDHNPSLDMNEDSGAWNCPVCDYGGGLPQFVMKMNKVDFTTAVNLLNNNFILVVNEDIDWILQQHDRIDNEANQEVSKVADMGVRHAFARRVMSNFEKLSGEKKKHWFLVLIYVFHGADNYEESTYLQLLEEFFQDINGQ